MTAKKNTDYIVQDKKEIRLQKWMFMISLAAHLYLFVGSPLASFFNAHEILNETEIEVDIGSIGKDEDNNFAALEKATLSEKPTVRDNMLPQLPKNFEIKSKDQPSDESSEEVLAANNKSKKQKDKKEDQKQAASENKESNTMDAEELQKRLALEKLKELAQKDKSTSVQDNKSNAVNINNIDGKMMVQNTGTSISPRVGRACTAMIRKLMRNYFSLPANYYLEKPNIEVQISTIINDKGDITGIQVAKSSGDPTFDEIVQKAVSESSPFPEVCYPLAGLNIQLNFSPRTI